MLIKKACINTTEIVEWEYFPTTVEAIESLKSQESRVKVIAVELAENSVPYTEYTYELPVALVVGHESDGVSQLRNHRNSLCYDRLDKKTMITTII